MFPRDAPRRRLVPHRRELGVVCYVVAGIGSERRRVCLHSGPKMGGEEGLELTCLHSGLFLTERSFLIRPGFKPGLFDPDGSGRDPIPGQNQQGLNQIPRERHA